MSLDKNLFTLTFSPHKDNPNILDLVDPVGTIHYRKQKVVGSKEYKIELYDPFSESLLATVTAPSAVSKTKTIELYNPTSNVEMKYTGALSFKWSFKWEDNEFEWKREECFIVRKPDPPVIVAVTKDPGRLKPATIQLLDYNINRFEINDRKGLEIVILAVLLTFADANDAAHSADGHAGQSSVLSRNTSAAPSKPDAPPPPPPKPVPKTGVERIAEMMRAVQGEYNEIIISDEGSVADYAAYCNKLLQDDAILFVSLKSAEAEQVPKVLQVVEETKRIRHKAGLDEEEGLHQYVLYDQKDPKKGPRVINLDDDDKKKYAPPKNLTVHLSKIAMPELQPPKSPGSNDKNPKGFDAVKEGKKAFHSLFSRPPAVAPTSRPPPATTASRPPPAATTSRPQSAGTTPRPQPAGTTSRPHPAGTTPRPQPAGNTPRPQPPTGRPSSTSSLPPPKAGHKLQRPSLNNFQKHMPPYQGHPNQPPMPPPHMPSPHLKNPPAYSFSPPPKGNYDKPRPPGPPGPSNSFPPPWATGKGQQPGLYPPNMPPSNTSPYPYASGPSNFPSGKRPPSPMPPPPPFSAVPTESSGSGSKPQSNAATIVQGASTVVQGFMGLIASGKLK